MRTLALVVAATLSFSVVAEDKKALAKPTGTWSRDADGVEIRLSFPKDQAKFTVKVGEATLTVTCKCEMDKDGLLKATITDVKVKGDFPEPPKKDQEMTFKFAIDGKKAKLTDFTSKDVAQAKAIVEGDYESKAD